MTKRHESIPGSSEEPEAPRIPIDSRIPQASGSGNGSTEFGRDDDSRYEIGELVGRGGMGQVYEAFERRLQRRVALKLLHSDDPDQVERFLREARAQARIDHENVCKVYGVGELAGGKPYIAMQYIDGEPLFVVEGGVGRPCAALAEMNLEQKIAMMQRVAEGIHAAHREGLIHRDIKPANIMVEKMADGSFRPHVLDFGLARSMASQAATSLGLMVGTPNFMSPEQARGDNASLDRRTDVYGLGATLYAILSGRPPFEALSSLDVLIKVAEEEVPPLVGVPSDVAAVVAKCLEKEPAARYDSARALAEDLGRYLDGEPIAVRRSNLGYRLWKKAKKHKALAGVSAAAVVLLTFLGGVSARTQLQARERARLAGVFGQEVKAIESQMRIAHLLPEHDITPEKNAIRQRMSTVEARMDELGSVAEGPGHYALGRGYLSLKEYETAREHLERSWESGYREGEVAFALGQVMGALYQKELAAVEKIKDEKKREERRRQAERDYRAPALGYLAESRGVEVEAPAYVEAFVAFYERRYDEALEKAQMASASFPWLYEARDLEARVHQAIGYDKHRQGEREAAVEAYDRAQSAYGRSFEIGRSYSAAAAGLCQLEAKLMEMELYQGSGEIDPYFEKGIEACDRAIRIEPESGEAHLNKMQLLWRMGESEWRGGKDPRQTLDRALEAGRIVLRLTPDDAQIHRNLGIVSRYRGQYELDHGIDATASLEQATRHIERSIRLAPNDRRCRNDLGNTYLNLATNAQRNGADPVAFFDKGVDAYKSALAIQPDYYYAFGNLTLLLNDRASYELEHGVDPSASLAAADEARERALAANPREFAVLQRLAETHFLRARYRLAEGKDPTESLTRATEAYEEYFSVSSNDVRTLVAAAEVMVVWGRLELEHDRDPGASLQAGREWVQQALALDPSYARALWSVTRLDVLEGRWRMARGLSPEAAFEHAYKTAQRAVELNPMESSITLAEVLRWRARWNRQRPQTAAREIAHGLEVLDEALAIKPDLAQGHALRGALCLEQARLEPAERSRFMAQAEKSLERALAINRFLNREYGPLLEQAREGSR